MICCLDILKLGFLKASLSVGLAHEGGPKDPAFHFVEIASLVQAKWMCMTTGLVHVDLWNGNLAKLILRLENLTLASW